MKFLLGRDLSCFDEENHHPGGVEASGVVILYTAYADTRNWAGRYTPLHPVPTLFRKE